MIKLLERLQEWSFICGYSVYLTTIKEKSDSDEIKLNRTFFKEDGFLTVLNERLDLRETKKLASRDHFLLLNC